MIDSSIDIVYDYNKSLNELQKLVDKRKTLLSESTGDAIIATVITILKSLRADSKIAPKKAKPSSFNIIDTGFFGGWERVGGKFHRVVRASNARHAPKIPGIFPVNNAGQHYEKNEIVKVYKVEPVNDEVMSWKKTKHKGCWYVFAKSQNVAEKFAELHMTKRISSYRGLAKSALGFAMAAVSNRGTFAAEVKSSKSIKAAQQAVSIIKANDGENFSITVDDLLRYSKSALKSGTNGLVHAMMKAANSIAGRLSKVATAKLDTNIITPFPEVKG